jgi:hypothetical protein
MEMQFRRCGALQDVPGTLHLLVAAVGNHQILAGLDRVFILNDVLLRYPHAYQDTLHSAPSSPYYGAINPAYLKIGALMPNAQRP